MQKISPEELYRKFCLHPYISTDSRKALAGSLFFALKGENFNANMYAAQALENGAAYAVIDDPAYFTGEQTLLVEDVLQALQQLASDYRAQIRIPVIGITGTNGKTTTKELMATALSARFHTHATVGNLNNHIGVPITILNIKPETEIAVIEMGANHIGEIAALCQIARPTHGLITNIGKAHLEGFGSAEGVIKAKSELYDYLRNHGGRVFVNADNALLMSLTEGMERILYGSSSEADLHGFVSGKGPMLEVVLDTENDLHVKTRLAGNYNFENLMAAMCIAGHFRVDLGEAVKAVENYEPRMNRSQIIENGRNTIIMDAYNANPSSMRVALANFATVESAQKVLILGDMFELGNEAPAEHTAVLQQAVEFGFDVILTAGPLFETAATEFGRVRAFSDVPELKAYLEQADITGAHILVKGSRGMKLETITDSI